MRYTIELLKLAYVVVSVPPVIYQLKELCILPPIVEQTIQNGILLQGVVIEFFYDPVMYWCITSNASLSGRFESDVGQ